MPNFDMDSDDNDVWGSTTSIDDSNSTRREMSNISRFPLMTSETSTQVTESDSQLPALISDSDSDDDSTWNDIGGYSSGSSDTSDGEFSFNGNVSDASEDSSMADDDDDYGVFEMLSNHFDVFNNFVPAFFGVSLQMLYARIMENMSLDEEGESPTPQNILDELPSTKVTPEQIASNLSCCICFCEYSLNEELLQLPCSHIYHKPCILDWLKIKCTCPTCRWDLTTNTDNSNEPNQLSDFSAPNSSSENLVYNIDREHIYDAIESYNSHALSTNHHSDSSENITDLPTMSTATLLANNNINISSSEGELRTPPPNAQTNSVGSGGASSGNGNTTRRTRYVTNFSPDGASNSSSVDFITTTTRVDEVSHGQQQNSTNNGKTTTTKRFSRETEIW